MVKNQFCYSRKWFYYSRITWFWLFILLSFFLKKKKNSGIKPVEPTKKEEVKKKNETINGNCCECPKDKKISEIEKSERMMTIYFENFLQNNVFVKRYQKIVKFDSFCSRFFFAGVGWGFLQLYSDLATSQYFSYEM